MERIKDLLLLSNCTKLEANHKKLNNKNHQCVLFLKVATPEACQQRVCLPRPAMYVKYTLSPSAIIRHCFYLALTFGEKQSCKGSGNSLPTMF